MDVFAEHGVAGIIGLIFNGLFAADYIIGLDGVNTGLINGGWINHNYKQLYIQVAYIVACVAYSFVMSTIIAVLVNITPGLHLRASEEAELLGMDDDQLGEFAYDYVEVRRDYLAWTPAKDEPENAESKINPGDRHGIPEHSEMIQGQLPSGDVNEGGQGHTHTAVTASRQGIAADDAIKEKRGIVNGQ
jgi:ammonium transporter, Amt family